MPENSFEVLLQKAQSGDAESQKNLGDCYFNGDGVEQSFEEAVKWYEKAAEQGLAEAQINLAEAYFFGGCGLEENKEKACECIMKAAEQGDAEAQYIIGRFFMNGIVLEKNDESAFYWNSKAAEQGQPDAQNEVGEAYRSGYGVEQNYEEAMKWFRKAAEQGHAGGQSNLAYCYFQGNGVLQDYSTAIHWSRKAAEQKSPEAQNLLGKCYLEGWGVEQDKSIAFEWYKKSADQGNAIGQYSVGSLYNTGQGVEENSAEAFNWYKKSADQGYVDGQLLLGVCYRDGTGIEKNEAKAFEWFLKAAEQDDSYGQKLIGDCFRKGIGTEQDYAKAFEWYMKSALQNNVNACERIVDCYCYGEGIPLDYKKAFEWGKRAAELGSINNQISIAFCTLMGVDDYEVLFASDKEFSQELNSLMFNSKFNPKYKESNAKEAFEWMLKAAKQGESYAQLFVGIFYLRGIGTEKKETTGFEWIMSAAENGNIEGMYLSGIFLLEGDLIDRDEERAIGLLSKAIEQMQDPVKYLSFNFFIHLFALCIYGNIYERIREIVDKILKDAEKEGVTSIEFFSHLLYLDYENTDQCKKQLELCEKHKTDSGGCAYYLLGKYYEINDDSLLKNLVNQNNARAYFYHKKADEYGYIEYEETFEQFYGDKKSIADYDMIDAKMGFDVDPEKLGKAIEKIAQRLSSDPSLMAIPGRFVNEPIVGGDSLMSFMFDNTINWDIEKMPNYSIKIRNNIVKAGKIRDDEIASQSLYERDKEVNMVSRHVDNLGKDIDRISNDELKAIIDEVCRECGEGTKERVFNKIRYEEQSFGDMKDGGGDFFDYQEDRKRQSTEQQIVKKEELDQKELLSNVRQAVMLLDQDDYVRKWVKNRPAAGTCILARVLNQGKGFAFDKNDIIRLLGETENFTYDISAISEVLFDDAVPDKEICALIGIDHPSYSRSKEKTMIPLLQKYFKMVFPEIRENGDEIEIVSGGSSDNYGKATSHEKTD